MKSDTIKLNFDTQHNEWRMAVNQGMAKGPGHYDKLKVDPGDTGLFTFVIQNPNDVTFAADPFTQKKGAVAKGDFDKQFMVDPAGVGTQSLVVKDANSNGNGTPYNGGDYHYEIHFSNGTTLDPVVTNGGCCQPLIGANNTVAFLAVGVLALVVIWLLFLRPKPNDGGPGSMSGGGTGSGPGGGTPA